MKFSCSLCLCLCVVWLLTAEAAQVRKLNRAKSAKGNNGRGKAHGREAEIDSLIDEVSAPATSRNKKSKKDAEGNGLIRRSQKADREQGERLTRMQQTFEDLPVFGAEIVSVVQEAKTVRFKDKGTKQLTGKTKRVEGKVDTHGAFFDGLKHDLGRHRGEMRRMTPSRALGALRRSDRDVDMTNCTSVSMIYVDPETMEAIPAYYASCFSTPKAVKDKQNIGQPTMIFDLKMKVIKKWDDLNGGPSRGLGPGGNAKVGAYNYGRDRPFIPLTEVAGECFYATPDLFTVDLRPNPVYGWQTIWTSHKTPCYVPFQGDAINGAQSPLNDVQYFGQRTVDMYKYWYLAKPFDNLFIQKVHHGYNYMNAHLMSGTITKSDGTSEVFYMSVFGDGNGLSHPLTSLDVVAHEHGHAVTKATSNLLYVDQSGGLNEAFSDMAGKAAEFFLFGSVQSWGMGYDVIKSASGSFRCMDAPCATGLGHSINHISQYVPGMEVHTSSGIFNKVFYEMATTLPYGPWDAFDFFYIANTKKWTTNTGFVEAAELVLETIVELKAGQHLPWGYQWIDINLVVTAFRKVGINCDPATLTCA